MTDTRAFWTLTGVIRRLVLSRSRVAIVGALGAVLFLASIAVRVGGSDRIAAGLVVNGVLLLALPLVTLVIAVAALGEARDDETLVYLWLKPVPRWQVALAASLATWTTAGPLTAGIGVLVAVGSARIDLIVPVIVAVTLGTLAYGAAFVALGLRTTRSLLSGLGFVLLWEGFFATLATGPATFTLRRWITGLFANLGDTRSPLAAVSTPRAVLVLVAVTVAGVLLTTRWLIRRDIP